MGLQSVLSSLLVDDNQLYPEEDICCVYHCFCWSIWVVIHIYYFSEIAVIWVTFSLWTMFLWRGKCLFFHVESMYKSVFFQVRNWLGPWSLIRYGLIMLTSVFLNVLTLIWSILVVKCISKFSVDNGFTHGMGCWHFYICCFYSFKYFFNCGVEYSGEMVLLWYSFNISIIWLKVSHVALEVFEYWHFRYLFTCAVVYLSCFILQQEISLLIWRSLRWNYGRVSPSPGQN